VTGAASGIGAAVATRLAQDYEVVGFDIEDGDLTTDKVKRAHKAKKRKRSRNGEPPKRVPGRKPTNESKEEPEERGGGQGGAAREEGRAGIQARAQAGEQASTLSAEGEQTFQTGTEAACKVLGCCPCHARTRKP